MSTQSLKKALATSACLMLLALVPQTEAAVCSILEVRGANGKTTAGFGVYTDGSVPRSGDGDTGADATEFNAGANPNPVCGSVAKLQGHTVDIATHTQAAIAAGLPLVYGNGSVPMTVFQVNRGGGGPMTCEYSADATGNSWQPMDTTLNMPGNFGLMSVQNVMYTVVATFRAGARLTGGSTGNVGLIRCRAGVDGVCGGCFAVQMSGQVVQATASASPVQAALEQTHPDLQLTSQQLSTLMAKVVELAKEQNLVTASS